MNDRWKKDRKAGYHNESATGQKLNREKLTGERRKEKAEPSISLRQELKTWWRNGGANAANGGAVQGGTPANQMKCVYIGELRQPMPATHEAR